MVGGLGPSSAALYRQSFPQPDDVDFDEDEPEVLTPIAEDGASEPMAIDPVDTRREREEAETGDSAVTQNPFVDAGSGTLSPAPTGHTDEVSPTLRPSSTSRVNDTYFTAPEHKSQKDRYRTLVSSSRILEDCQEDLSQPEPETGIGDGNPSVYVVPSHEHTEHSPAMSTVNGAPVAGEMSSRASLLHYAQEEEQEEEDAAAEQDREDTPKGSDRSLERAEPHIHDREMPASEEVEDDRRLDRRVLEGVSSVRFSMQNRYTDQRERSETRRSKQHAGSMRRQQRRSASREGEIIRAERMLVRMDITQQDVPNDYGENASLAIDTRPAEKWREYLVVCRKGYDEETPFILQLYKTRVIPQVQAPRVKRRFSHEILLRRSTTKVNMFSCLDKTMVIWYPYREWTRVFIMRTRSAAHSVEWYTFIREALGWLRPSTLMVHVPDLDMSLHLKNPFAHLEVKQNLDTNCLAIILETMAREQAVASGIINTCLDTLRKCPQLSSVVEEWTKGEKIGLAWRRYDRLEWVQGANEKRMYGAHAMRESNELELRPRRHSPTHTETTRLEEPPPIEGFLILLTSQRGHHKRLGKTLNRRLYFSTQDHHLFFCKPSKASPPPPPRFPTISGAQVPTSDEIRRESPMMHDVDPYPVNREGKISWLVTGRKPYVKRHDTEAYGENRRNTENLANAEGYFNLCKIVEVRPVTACEDDMCENGGDVDFHGHARGGRDNPLQGVTSHDHENQTMGNRTFELVLDSGLLVRVRTYNMQTRDQWVERLRSLSAYWKSRRHDDVSRLKSVRQRNLDIMGIDEEQESRLGQMAQKWEVGQAVASPELFNACGVSGCRAVKVYSYTLIYMVQANNDHRCPGASTGKPAAGLPLTTAP